MRFEVRGTADMKLLGTVEIRDARLLRKSHVHFVCPKDTRYYGRGRLLELEHPSHKDFSIPELTMFVGQFVEPPTITDAGEYRPGRCELVLQWDGPAEALRDVRGFEAAR